MNSLNPQPNVMRLAAAALLILSAGCSPKVYTSVQKSYSPRAADSPVTVYQIGEPVPVQAERLGSVTVEDTGFSTNCDYPQVIQLAKVETNKAGGNCLQLTYHRKPSFFGSSCHRIGGDMLLLPDSVDNTHVPATLYPSEQPGLQSAQMQKREPIFGGYVNGGWSFIMSDFYIPEQYSGNPRNGFDLNAGLYATSHSGWGGGIRYSGYFTGMDYGIFRDRIRIHYIAPEVYFRAQFARKWVYNCWLGVGYAHYSEHVAQGPYDPIGISSSFGGWGTHIGLGIEYRCTKHIGISMETSVYSTRFKAMDNIVQYYDSDKLGGIVRLSLNGGIRVYF